MAVATVRENRDTSRLSVNVTLVVANSYRDLIAIVILWKCRSNFTMPSTGVRTPPSTFLIMSGEKVCSDHLKNGYDERAICKTIPTIEQEFLTYVYMYISLFRISGDAHAPMVGVQNFG